MIALKMFGGAVSKHPQPIASTSAATGLDTDKDYQTAGATATARAVLDTDSASNVTAPKATAEPTGLNTLELAPSSRDGHSHEQVGAPQEDFNPEGEQYAQGSPASVSAGIQKRQVSAGLLALSSPSMESGTAEYSNVPPHTHKASTVHHTSTWQSNGRYQTDFPDTSDHMFTHDSRHLDIPGCVSVAEVGGAAVLQVLDPTLIEDRGKLFHSPAQEGSSGCLMPNTEPAQIAVEDTVLATSELTEPVSTEENLVHGAKGASRACDQQESAEISEIDDASRVLSDDSHGALVETPDCSLDLVRKNNRNTVGMRMTALKSKLQSLRHRLNQHSSSEGGDKIAEPEPGSDVDSILSATGHEPERDNQQTLEVTRQGAENFRSINLSGSFQHRDLGQYFAVNRQRDQLTSKVLGKQQAVQLRTHSRMLRSAKPSPRLEGLHAADSHALPTQRFHASEAVHRQAAGFLSGGNKQLGFGARASGLHQDQKKPVRQLHKKERVKTLVNRFKAMVTTLEQAAALDRYTPREPAPVHHSA